MHRAGRTRLGKHLAESDLDAIVCVSPENVAYAAGFVIPSQTLMRWRHAAVVITATGREAIVCVDMEESTVRATGSRAELRVWSEFTGNAMVTLAQLLADFGLQDGRVGIEFSYLPTLDHQRLLAELPDIQLVAIDAWLRHVRRIKTPEELALLCRLARVSDHAIRTSLEAVRAGDSEMDIAAALTRSIYEQGAQSFKLMIVATGERSQLPNVGPSRRLLAPGDICRVEIFSVIDGYQAGVCRTAVVGEPPPHARRIYRNLIECQGLVLAALKPGVATTDVYRVYRRKFDELGLAPLPFVGHSIGVDLHEPPYLGAYGDDFLEAGMVLGIEPLAYRTGHGFGMQIKDMVAVSEAGSLLLSDVTDTSELFRIEA